MYPLCKRCLDPPPHICPQGFLPKEGRGKKKKGRMATTTNIGKSFERKELTSAYSSEPGERKKKKKKKEGVTPLKVRR